LDHSLAIECNIRINGSLAPSPRGTANFPLPIFFRGPKLPLEPGFDAGWSPSEVKRRVLRLNCGREREEPAMAFARKAAFTAA